MATKKAVVESTEISITTLQEGEMTFCILGTSPLICNRMAMKAWHDLLMPYKKTAADKAGSLKHDPIAEFRASPYLMRHADAPNGAEAPTALAVLPTYFKQAMCTAALRTPGAKKTEIAQLVNVQWDRMPVYGVPKVFCSITRSADMNRTPDVRTRAIIPEWACVLKIRFQKPILREQTIADLLAIAGRVSGIGDWRQEKGSGSFGSFALVSADHPDFVRIMQLGREVQEYALDNPEAYDEETAELLSWFEVETKKRGFTVPGLSAERSPDFVGKPSDAAKKRRSVKGDEAVLGRYS